MTLVFWNLWKWRSRKFSWRWFSEFWENDIPGNFRHVFHNFCQILVILCPVGVEVVINVAKHINFIRFGNSWSFEDMSSNAKHAFCNILNMNQIIPWDSPYSSLKGPPFCKLSSVLVPWDYSLAKSVCLTGADKAFRPLQVARPTSPRLPVAKCT